MVKLSGTPRSSSATNRLQPNLRIWTPASKQNDAGYAQKDNNNLTNGFIDRRRTHSVHRKCIVSNQGRRFVIYSFPREPPLISPITPDHFLDVIDLVAQYSGLSPLTNSGTPLSQMENLSSSGRSSVSDYTNFASQSFAVENDKSPDHNVSAVADDASAQLDSLIDSLQLVEL